MSWLTLVVAGLLEIVWAIALKRSGGFSRPVPSIIGVTSAVASFLMLASALKTLPVGTAYAVWVGIGAVGVAIAGMLLEGESVGALRILFLGLIVAGVIGLKVVHV